MTDQQSTSRHAQAQHYQICVSGRLEGAMLRAFEGLEARAQGRYTILSGTLPDQAALYGVLGQLESFALELLEVRRVPSVRAWQTQISPDARIAGSPCGTRSSCT
jgi:hypothetical protein